MNKNKHKLFYFEQLVKSPLKLSKNKISSSFNYISLTFFLNELSFSNLGWDEGSERFSLMARHNTSRAQFVQHSVSFLKTNKFDGLDLNWEYPGKLKQFTRFD